MNIFSILYAGKTFLLNLEEKSTNAKLLFQHTQNIFKTCKFTVLRVNTKIENPGVGLLLPEFGMIVSAHWAKGCITVNQGCPPLQ